MTSNMTQQALADAAKLLRAAGWGVLQPVGRENDLPEPAVGQTWHSTKPGSTVEPRSIFKIGPHRSWPDQPRCIYFTKPSDDPNAEFPNVLSPIAWTAWARRGKCRPMIEVSAPPSFDLTLMKKHAYDGNHTALLAMIDPAIATLDRYILSMTKIAERFPCRTIADMRRVAAETLGLPVPTTNND